MGPKKGMKALNKREGPKFESLAMDTSWGFNTIFNVGLVEEFETLPKDILWGHMYLIHGEYFNRVTIFRSLVPTWLARASKISFQLWRCQAGRPLIKLLQSGVDVVSALTR